MKRKYRGHEIEVTREKCLGGWGMLYFNVYTDDGYECIVSFEDSKEKIIDKINELKERIDNELKESDPWGRELGLV